MRQWLWRLWTSIGRRSFAAGKSEEMNAHLSLEIEDGIQRGLTPAEARRRAKMHSGQVPQALEASLDEIGFHPFRGIAGDFRHALRALVRNPGFGSVAVLVLTFSVAINTLIFCMLDGVVLRPLPYRNPDRLVRLYDSSTGQPKFPMSRGRFLDFRADAKSIESIALYTGGDAELSGLDGRSQRLSALAITPEYFSLLGKKPFRGRFFTETEMRGEVHDAIISYNLWREQFQSDPVIVGKSIHLYRQLWTIIGVAPRGFQHVGGDYRSPMQGETVDVWVPLQMDSPELPLRAFHFTNAIARIREPYSMEQAHRELSLLSDRYNRRYPAYGKWDVRMEPLLTEVAGRSRQLLWLLTAAGALVMLIAYANIAGLCIARAVSRRKELALRQALGANRWQLLRVGLAENLWIGCAGAILGLLLAAAGMPLLRQLLPSDFPRAQDISLSLSSTLFATAIALATVLIAGILPGLGGTLESQRATAGHESRKLRTALVASEIALAGLLCASALFLLRSYREIGARDHGFNPAGVLTFQLTVPADGSKPGYIARTFNEILTKIREIPGVTAAGATTNLPWSGYDENAGFSIVGQPPSRNQDMGARYQAATDGYFEAAGMRLLSGRFFRRDLDVAGKPPTLIVNDALAQRYFPAGNALGAQLNVGVPRRIVGIVQGIPDFPADLDVKPAFWYPIGQAEFGAVFFAVRVKNGDPASLAAAAADAVHFVDPNFAVAEVRTLQSCAASALAARRFALWLFQSFAILAMVLAAAGIYSLLAYMVQQRHKELSIRVVLGAQRAELRNMILSDALRMASVGALCSLALIPMAGFLLRGFLYNVKAFDLYALIGAPAMLLIVSLLAGLAPARSAARNDPAAALRQD